MFIAYVSVYVPNNTSSSYIKVWIVNIYIGIYIFWDKLMVAKGAEM